MAEIEHEHIPQADYYCDRTTIMRYATLAPNTDEECDIRAIAIDLLEYMDEEKAKDDADAPNLYAQLKAAEAEIAELRKKNEVRDIAMEKFAKSFQSGNIVGVVMAQALAEWQEEHPEEKQ